MKKIIDLCKKNGFVYQGSEIYGGLANSWDYGPLGTVLKENIKNAWLKHFVKRRTDMVQIDSSVILSPKVWKASGHEDSFADPLIECKKCHSRMRFDKLIEAKLEKNPNFKVPNNWAGDKTPLEDINIYLFHNVMDYMSISNYVGLTCQCGSADFSEAQYFNLMLSTRLGAVDDGSDNGKVYLRPETAQGIFINFQNLIRSSKKKIPFGVAQFGKAYRNEITPRNFIFRTREFEQMEIEYFCEPGTDEALFEEFQKTEREFFTNGLGLKEENVQFVEIDKDALPHYSKRAGDFEYLYPFGWGEISTLANRTDYDLKAHMKSSGADMAYLDQQLSRKYIPFVIEPSMGLSRLVLATICDAYDEVSTENGMRVVMRFKKSIAPIKIAVLPVVKKHSEKALDLYVRISDITDVEYDESGTVGKRFYRMDELGVPYCITVDDSDTVKIRDRDTGEQVEMSVEECVEFVKNNFR